MKVNGVTVGKAASVPSRAGAMLVRSASVGCGVLTVLLAAMLPFFTGGCDRGGLSLQGRSRAVGSYPADGDVEVPRRLEVRVFFDRPLAPRSVSRSAVTLRSGPQTRFLSVRYDPVDRALVARDFFDFALEPRVEHELEVVGVMDLAGSEIPRYAIRFVTGEVLGEVPPLGAASWEEASAIFSSRCAGTGCHGGAVPALGLDLSSAAGIRATAFGVPAVSDSIGGLGPRGLSGFPRIDLLAGAGRPETSRLVYEVLRDPRVGQPMPPDEPLPLAEARVLVDWILAGAPTE